MNESMTYKEIDNLQQYGSFCEARHLPLKRNDKSQTHILQIGALAITATGGARMHCSYLNQNHVSLFDCDSRGLLAEIMHHAVKFAVINEFE